MNAIIRKYLIDRCKLDIQVQETNLKLVQHRLEKNIFAFEIAKECNEDIKIAKERIVTAQQAIESLTPAPSGKG